MIRCTSIAPALALMAAGSLGAISAQAQDFSQGFNTFGMPGAIDTPNAAVLPDGEMMFTGVATRDSWRTTLTFQALPRVTMAFRYASIDDLDWRAMRGTGLRDRSLDIQFQLLNEGEYTPALALGLRDFLGTGSYSSEYIVASKTFSPQLRGSLGLGWGRLASHGSFSNPLGVLHSGFKTRPDETTGLGGRIEAGRFFRGDAAFFASLEYQATPELTLMAEYSSDAYPDEGLGLSRRTPLNFGFRYQLSDSTTLAGYVIQGRNVGLGLNFALNPRVASARGLQLNAPPPVLQRPPASGPEARSTAWTNQREEWRDALTDSWGSALAENGMTLEGVTLEDRRAILRLTNVRHEILSRALGRAARVSTYGLPPSIEEIVVIPVVDGISGTAVVFNREALEAHEFTQDGAQQILATTRFEDALNFPGTGRYWQPLPADRSRFTWSLGPYLDTSYFDPNTPIRADVGLRLDLQYHLSENLAANLEMRQRLVGNISGGSIGNPSPGYPRVRTTGLLYSSSSPVVERATLDYKFRPAQDFYGRLSLGMLERMYAGASAELLWSRVDSPLALGVEVNALRQRAPDSLLGTNNLRVNSWHVSGYYSFGDGFHAQLDLGRYLAGDMGGTLTLEREFANGIRVGAFATLTDMPFDVFGEGSFDKGIHVTIPLATILGAPSTASQTTSIRSVTRDGGARVNIANRLYPSIRDTRERALRSNWEAVLQ